MSLVLLAHGSVNPAGPRMVELLAARVRLRLPGVPVRPAYVEHVRPSLADVLVEAGRDAVVVPLLCAPGLDSPDPRRPSVLVADPLGPDRLLAGVQVTRLRAAGARPGQPVVMVGPGTDLLGSQRDSVRAAQLLQELWGGPVRAAHLTGHGERMSQVVAEFRARDLALPAVSPYLVAPGHLLSKARQDARNLGIDLVADVLGDHPHVAEAVARRYRATTARQFALTLREALL